MKEKETPGFSLKWVYMIIFITAIVTSLTTGIIIYNNSKIVLGASSLKDDDALREFLKVYNSLDKSYYKDIDKTEMVEVAISAMLDFLGEDYSTYMTKTEKDDLAERLSGKFQGIGISLLNNEIVDVYKDTPAEKAGLKSGDRIVELNGTNTENISQKEIANLIDKTNENTITVSRGEEKITAHVTAQLINTPLNSQIINKDDNEIAYIQIESFTNTVGEEFKKSLEDLEEKGAQNLIIDMRSNSGGFLKGAMEIANLFLEKDSLVYSLEGKDKKENFYDTTSESRNYKIAILIDESTASASEVLASALKDNKPDDVYLIGKKTFGKGKVQQTKNLEDGSMIKYTSAKWYRPNGECIDEIGITPDYDIDYIQDEEGNWLDTPLEKALELLK